MSKRFYFGEHGDDSDESIDDLDSLPYPKPLERSDFLVPSFSASEYLSTLHNRHQTLEDLRAELRTLSQDLNKELLDLVNNNYQDFLGLGSSLKGGEEKVEEVRLGLLGFRREVEGLRKKVTERREEVESLVEERKSTRAKIQTGRQLLDLDNRISELEQRLLLSPKTQKRDVENGDHDAETESDFDSDDEDEGDDANEEIGQPAVRKLRRCVEQYMLIKNLFEKLGSDQPFVAKQEDRVLRVRRTLVLDLNSSLKQAILSGGDDGRARLFMLETYRILGDSNEAMKIIRETASHKV